MCLNVDPNTRSSAEELLKASSFLQMKESNQILENKSSFQLFERINVPRKKDFRIIKDRLPKNRFSVDKIMTNSSYMSDKENNQNLANTLKIIDDGPKAIRKQTLPAIPRPNSASN